MDKKEGEERKGAKEGKEGRKKGEEKRKGARKGRLVGSIGASHLKKRFTSLERFPLTSCCLYRTGGEGKKIPPSPKWTYCRYHKT